VVRDIPRHVIRELDQQAVRAFKRRALHFHLDARRPEMKRDSESGAPGRRATLAETVESYLTKRPMEPGLDRATIVALGLSYLSQADASSEAVSTEAGSNGAKP
jgi:hypothetical protein